MNFNDENTILVVYKNNIQIIQSLINPSIFRIQYYPLNLIRPDFLRDLFSIYIYVN